MFLPNCLAQVGQGRNWYANGGGDSADPLMVALGEVFHLRIICRLSQSVKNISLCCNIDLRNNKNAMFRSRSQDAFPDFLNVFVHLYAAILNIE